MTLSPMTTITIYGEIPNLTLLLHDIGPHLGDQTGSNATLCAETPDPNSLHSADWGALLINLGTGLAAGAAWDAIKLAVAAARRRGQIEVSPPLPQNEVNDEPPGDHVDPDDHDQ